MQTNSVPFDCRAFWRWTLYSGFSSLIAFGLYSAEVALFDLDKDESVLLQQKTAFVLFAVMSAVIEGSAIGYLQWRVLSPLMPNLSIRNWLSLTVAISIVLAVLSSLPILLTAPKTPELCCSDNTIDLPWWLLQVMFLILFAPVGLIIGAVIGLAQWLLLRKHHVPISWVATNALSVTLALIVAFAVVSWVDEDTPGKVVWAQAAIGILLGGFIFGGLTGLSLRRMFPASQA